MWYLIGAGNIFVSIIHCQKTNYVDMFFILYHKNCLIIELKLGLSNENHY